jgi:hypothetical protein
LGSLALVWLIASAVTAAPPPGPAEGQRVAARVGVVVLVPERSDRRVDDVVASASANLPHDEVELVALPFSGVDTLPRRVARARQAADAHAARGVFWLDLRDDQRYVVYLWVARDGTLLRREVPEAAQSIEAAVESMWIIVRAGSLALASGVEVAMEAVDPRTIVADAESIAMRPATPEPDRPTTHRLLRTSAWWSIAYVGVAFGRTMPWHSGALLEARGAVHRHFALGLAYGASTGPPTKDAEALRLVRHEIIAVVAAGAPLAPRLRLDARLLAGLDLLRWRSSGQDTAGLEALGKAGIELTARVHLRPGLTFDVAAGGEAWFRRFDFVLCAEQALECSGDARRVAFSPWPVRPRVRAGLSGRF